MKNEDLFDLMCYMSEVVQHFRKVGIIKEDLIKVVKGRNAEFCKNVRSVM